MKKSELKELLKVIVQEVVAAKQEQLNETKGLSGMKKAPESTEHTEKVADSKDLTGPAPKEKEEGKKLPVVKKPANPQKVGDLKEGFGDMLQTYADWSLFIKDIASVGAFIVAGLLLGYIWLSDVLKTKLRSIIKSKVGQEFDSYLESRANELKNDPAIQAALADPNHKGLHIAIKAKLNQQDMEMNKKVNSAIGYNNLVSALGKAVSKSAAPKTPSLKQEIIQMIREEIDEMARTAGAIGNKYKVQDPNSPTGWSIKGHKNVPDGTPTEAPKGGAPTASTPTSTPSKPATDKAAVARTEDAVENILKFKPNATEQEVADELAKQSAEDAPLSLDATVISSAIAKAKEGTAGEEGSSEPDVASLAAKEKAEKEKKIRDLRAYLLRKRGIKPA